MNIEPQESNEDHYMNTKRIKCILTGGCKFKAGTTNCHIDENNIVTITETCCRCGKQYSFSAPYSAFESCTEEIHEEMLKGEN